MTLVERLRAALEEGNRGMPELLTGDTHALEVDAEHTQAAVLIAVTDRAEPGVILTQRSASLRNHAGQVAFPGGRIDPGDGGPVSAALREAQEEIALPPEAVTVIGPVDRYVTVTGFQVTPVLGVVPPDLPLMPHEAEVADLFEIPLKVLLDPARHARHSRVWEGRTRHYYEISWGNRRVWGATAAMCVNLSRRLAW